LLHRAFRDDHLDFFVLCSSAASLLGSPGQAPYAAANAFLDGLALFRRSIGLPALSVNWGPWEHLGMATHDAGRQLARRGIGSISSAEGLAILGRLMRSPVAQIGVIPIDWDAAITAMPAARTAPLFELLNEKILQDHKPIAPNGTRAEILAATENARYPLAERLVREEIARVARLEPDGIDPHRSLDMLGIDSLMSIELKNRLERTLDVSIPVVRLLEVPTVAGLAALVVEELKHASATGTRAPAGSNGVPAASNGPPIVALRATGSASPLFLVHPGALDVRCYSDLAHGLGDDQPCYVLQPPELEAYRGLDAGVPLDVSIESIAAAVVEAIRSVQPRGPYRLGGWSLGGVVAFDVAQQLEAQGEAVSLLALLDAPAPVGGDRPEDWDDAQLLRLFASYLGARQGLATPLPPSHTSTENPNDLFDQLRDHALAAALVPADAETGHVRSLYTAYKTGLRMGTQLLWRYRPRAYTGPITYFRAA
jgi:acyl carrier protein